MSAQDCAVKSKQRYTASRTASSSLIELPRWRRDLGLPFPLLLVDISFRKKGSSIGTLEAVDGISALMVSSDKSSMFFTALRAFVLSRERSISNLPG
jgi:hypothetical protein